MPFHVEIRRSYNHARVFNVGEEELRRTVLEPWSRGGVVELGDREWDPRDCGLVVLEGPALEASDLALGQGWHRAERSARDVTARVLAELRSEPATVAVLAATPAGRRLAAALLERLGLRPVDWAAIRAGALGGADDAGAAAVILLVDETGPTASWLFEAGVAVGALGGRAIVAQVGAEPLPPEVQGLGVIRLEPDGPASLHALAERLARAGCAVAPA